MGKWMKAIACGLLLCLCISLCGFSAECGEIRERVLRLHILANSDSGEDQQLKLKVRDAVVREAYGLGVMDVIPKPVVPYLVLRRVQ